MDTTGATMTYHAAKATFGGIFTAGALAVGAVAGLGAAPTANATCASFFGIGNSVNCTSNATSIAIAIGDNAAAHASGILGAAYALGKDASAGMMSADIFTMSVALGQSAQAGSGGSLSTAIATGQNARSLAGSKGGIVNLAVDLGNHNPAGAVISDGYLNLAVDALGSSDVVASGIGNVAVNLLGKANFVQAYGKFNNATNFAGNSNTINQLVPVGGSTLTSAWVDFGTKNLVQVGKGPLIIAGSIFQKNSIVAKDGPGININGFKIGGAASRGRAVPAATTAVPSAATAAPSVKPVATVPSAPRAVATTRESTRVAK